MAAKIAIGYCLPEIPNSITRRTTCFFEPALDYLVCKFPRWDIAKFQGATARIGSEMKSVGEVMAIGRSFPEVIQKALRMLDIGVSGVDPEGFDFDDVEDGIRHATPLRIFAVANALWNGMPVARINRLSGIDPWFLHGIGEVLDCRRRLMRCGGTPDAETLRSAKQQGFSDAEIDRLTGARDGDTRTARKRHGIEPRLSCIDTMAAEFPAE